MTRKYEKLSLSLSYVWEYYFIPRTGASCSEGQPRGAAEQYPIGLSSTLGRLVVVGRPLSGTPVILGRDSCGELSKPLARQHFSGEKVIGT